MHTKHVNTKPPKNIFIAENVCIGVGKGPQ